MPTFSSARAFIITAVSSECNRFRTLQVPLPNAASTNARLEMLLLPGVAIVMGDLLGVPEGIVADSHRTLRITLSATTDAFSSCVLPMRERRTIFLAGTRILFVDAHDIQKAINRKLT